MQLHALLALQGHTVLSMKLTGQSVFVCITKAGVSIKLIQPPFLQFIWETTELLANEETDREGKHYILNEGRSIVGL